MNGSRMNSGLKKLEFLSLVPSSQEICPDKDKIIVFMKQSPVIAAAPGVPRNWITGETIPCEMLYYEACGYTWTSMDVWHFETYNLPLPDDFVAVAREHYLDHLYDRVKRRQGKKTQGKETGD